MDQNSDNIDPKGQGRPPPYSVDPPPPVTVVTHTSHTYPSHVMQPPVHGVMYQAGPAVPVVISHQPMAGTQPTPFTCKSCNELILTRVELKTSTKTHMFALLICCVFWPLVFLPYCIDSCNNADHYCPNCSAYIGSYTS